MDKQEQAFLNLCNVRVVANKVTSPQLFQWIKSSAYAGSYKIITNAFGQNVGYIIWANICKESLIKLKNTGAYPQHRYEWSEGDITLLLDVVINEQQSKLSIQQLRHFLKSKKIIAYEKNKIGKLYIKQGKVFQCKAKINRN